MEPLKFMLILFMFSNDPMGAAGYDTDMVYAGRFNDRVTCENTGRRFVRQVGEAFPYVAEDLDYKPFYICTRTFTWFPRGNR